MTPAIKVLNKAKINYKIHEYQHDPKTGAYGVEASEKLHVEASRVFKTLLVNVFTELVVAVIPVNCQLDLKRIAKVANSKKAIMAEPKEAERTTGYVIGGISPIGQKKKLKTVVDISAKHFDSIYVSAGRRGLEIELSAEDLAQILKANFASITNH